MNQTEYDAVVVGSGPNGLAAAIRMAQAGCSVLVVERNATPGGAARSAELTRPGFVHDLGSSIHPLGAASPFFQTLPLEKYGLKWIRPDVQVAQPIAADRAAALYTSVDRTSASLGVDGAAYARLVQPLVATWPRLADEILQPMVHLPKHPFVLTRFGLQAIRSARALAEDVFRGEDARALFAGIAAHAGIPLEALASAAFGLVLGLAGHVVGWPMPKGGAQAITDALVAHLESLGGEVVLETSVERLEALPPARVTLLDVTPRQLLGLAGDRLPALYRRRLERYRYGPGVFKIDYALDAPIPWTSEVCRKAGTVHVGGTFDEVAAAERAVTQGRHPERPFLLLAQHSLFDDTRAPKGKHTAWTYCHVPNGSTVDMTEPIERQIERFAPGFRETVLERHVTTPAGLEQQNPNLVGGDVNGGSAHFLQLLARPLPLPNPYRTPLKGVYLCSSSTPPGGGVHGMCGFHAAEAALKGL